MFKISGVFFLFILFFSSSLYARQIVHHDMLAHVVPDNNEIKVIDVIRFEQGKPSLSFVLHKGDMPVLVKGGKIEKLSDAAFSVRFPAFKGKKTSRGVPVEGYKLTLSKHTNSITLEYTLRVNHVEENVGRSGAKSIRDSAGVILPSGLYLAGETVWYPRFGDELLTFRLSVRLPHDWKSVSQGERKYLEDEKNYHLDTWEEKNAQDDIYLVAAKFNEYSQQANDINAMVFLRDADQALAKKYLDATAQYLRMYQRLLGEYPYKKFALVENFWQTGFGMPSFTLLGSRIIRFPFILNSSYPHELLHNWWGNSVYVDYEQGNWAEGLTAYLADFLLKEQQGRGLEYRRGVLQKYTNFTQAGGDFALNTFVSRYDAVTEAVGYGKTLMMFHMLRQALGDKVFIRGLQKFYLENRYKVAGYSVLEHTFSTVSGKKLAPFFDEWVSRVGAPSLVLENVRVKQNSKGKYRLSAVIRQSQPGNAYPLQVPVAVSVEGQSRAIQQVVSMRKKTHILRMQFDKKPLLVEVDPEFDVFRRLDANEVPPSISQAFGAAESMIIISSNESPGLTSAYKKMAQAWQASRPGKITIGFDAEFEKLPDNKVVWLLGVNNKFKSAFMATLLEYPFAADELGVDVKKMALKYEDNSLVLVSRAPADADYAFVYVSVDKAEAAPGLARKLPHYGKYSYLAFQGSAPTNTFKGQWPAINSPLRAGLVDYTVNSELARRQPLIGVGQ